MGTSQERRGGECKKVCVRVCVWTCMCVCVCVFICVREGVVGLETISVGGMGGVRSSLSAQAVSMARRWAGICIRQKNSPPTPVSHPACIWLVLFVCPSLVAFPQRNFNHETYKPLLDLDHPPPHTTSQTPALTVLLARAKALPTTVILCILFSLQRTLFLTPLKHFPKWIALGVCHFTTAFPQLLSRTLQPYIFLFHILLSPSFTRLYMFQESRNYICLLYSVPKDAFTYFANTS